MLIVRKTYFCRENFTSDFSCRTEETVWCTDILVDIFCISLFMFTLLHY